MMTAESILSKRPVLRFTVVLLFLLHLCIVCPNAQNFQQLLGACVMFKFFKSRPNHYYTRGITPKRVTSGGAQFHDLAQTYLGAASKTHCSGSEIRPACAPNP